MMRKIIRDYMTENPESPIGTLEAICKGNVGFVFSNGDLGEVFAKLKEKLMAINLKATNDAAEKLSSSMRFNS